MQRSTCPDQVSYFVFILGVQSARLGDGYLVHATAHDDLYGHIVKLGYRSFSIPCFNEYVPFHETSGVLIVA